MIRLISVLVVFACSGYGLTGCSDGVDGDEESVAVPNSDESAEPSDGSAGTSIPPDADEPVGAVPTTSRFPLFDWAGPDDSAIVDRFGTDSLQDGSTAQISFADGPSMDITVVQCDADPESPRLRGLATGPDGDPLGVAYERGALTIHTARDPDLVTPGTHPVWSGDQPAPAFEDNRYEISDSLLFLVVMPTEGEPIHSFLDTILQPEDYDWPTDEEALMRAYDDRVQALLDKGRAVRVEEFAFDCGA